MTLPLILQLDMDGLRKKSKDEIIAELFDEIYKRETEIEQLKKKLRMYENPHTPPSKVRFKQQRRVTASKTPKKRGAPAGHRGVTRPKPTPTKFIDVTAANCTRCNAELGAPVGVRTKLIEEIPEPLPIEHIQFNLHEYVCPECGEKIIARHELCPRKGRFGITFLALVIFLKIFMRGVMRKVPVFLQTQNGISISAATVNNILERVAASAETEFDALRSDIRRCNRLFVDETSFSVIGRNWWMWIFHSGEKILVVIRNSRGSEVLREILGPDWKGIINCDGWGAYGMLPYAILQRCWAHLLREAKDCATTTAGRHLHIKLTAMFNEAKIFIAGDHCVEERQAKAVMMEEEFARLCEYYSKYPELEKLCGYISNGGSDWFTAIRYEGIELTNNTAERGLREEVVMRNIMGALRSEKVKKYEILCSLFSTWQLNKQDCMANIKRILSAKLCLS